MKTPFQRLLAAAGNQPPLGCRLASASPVVAEAVGQAGFDWLLLDMAQAPLAFSGLVPMLQALTGARAVPVVRVPAPEAAGLVRAFDAGATTVLVPQVASVAQVQALAGAARLGAGGQRRPAPFSRAAHFGSATGALPCGLLLQLDSAEVVGQLGAFAGVAGVDGFFVDPGQFGAEGPTAAWPGSLHALLADAVRRARAAGRPIGTLAPDLEAATRLRAIGFDFLGVAVDLGLLLHGAAATLAALRTQQARPHVHSLQHGTRPEGPGPVASPQADPDARPA